MLAKDQHMTLVRLTKWVCQNWLQLFLIVFGLFNLLPFLAPVFASLGWQPVSDAILILYTPFCHQMAHRSFFLFGQQIMYTPAQLPVELIDNLADNMLALKYFTGNETLGWKVAWSDRMVYMYGSMWLAGLIFWLTSRRRRIKPIPMLVFFVLLLPMGLDGVSHTVSDFSGGLFDGFRYTNQWLADLTNNAFSDTFYRGDYFGTFNSWMRFISGIGFGIGMIGFFFPIIHIEMVRNWQLLDNKLRQYSAETGENEINE